MKKLFVLILLVNSAVFAQSRSLPPVIDNSSYPVGSKNGTASPSVSSNASYEMLERIEQLQQEIQQLRGVLEAQSQVINDVKKRQTNIYSDLDQRLQGIENQNATEIPVIDETGNQFIQPNPNNLQNKADPKFNEIESKLPNDTKNIDVEGDAVGFSRDQKTVYQEAYDSLRNGHNSQAISAFKSILIEFPQGEYSDNAQYWLGEAYKVNRDYKSAKQAFSKVALQYPNSPKVPDALLKLGYIELELNNPDKAKIYLTQLATNYPNSNASQLAAKKLIEMQGFNP